MNTHYSNSHLFDPDDPSDRDARHTQPPVDMDMNPMVDMAFLLLTFFMLATTFSQPRTMEIVMPPKPEPQMDLLEQPIKESKALTVILGNDDQAHWYRGVTEPELHIIPYGAAGLRPMLVRLNSEVPELVVLIKPLPDSRYENLVDVLDDLTLAGIERYALVELSDVDEALYRAGKTLQNSGP